MFLSTHSYGCHIYAWIVCWNYPDTWSYWGRHHQKKAPQEHISSSCTNHFNFGPYNQITGQPFHDCVQGSRIEIQQRLTIYRSNTKTKHQTGIWKKNSDNRHTTNPISSISSKSLCFSNNEKKKAPRNRVFAGQHSEEPYSKRIHNVILRQYYTCCMLCNVQPMS